MLGVIHICFGKSVEAYGRAFFDEVSTAKSFKLPINPNYDFTDYNHIIIMVNEDKKSQQHSIESTAWTRDISIGQNRVLFAVSTYSIAAFADLFDLEKINTKISRSSILPSVSFSVSFEKCGEHGADQLKIDIDNAIDDGFDLYFLIGDQLRKGNSTIRCDLKKTYPRWIKWGLFDSITKKLCSCGVRAVEHKMFLKKIADEDLKTIAIFGLARSGKSTFINTVFRTLTGIKKEFAVFILF